MSGDVQPRKRKDKKRKRDGADRKSEGEVSFSRQSSVQDDDESSHGVHITKMGSDDVHIHVQHDHGTGGHWCAKILFFSLLAVLLGLVGLIILENRGLSDLDTPLSESRFSNYFDGWVEEHRQEHDDHDPVQASIEEHDEHGEPFEEEEEDEEADEDDDDDDDNEHADDDDDDHDDEDDEEDDDDDGDEVEAEGEDEDTKDETQEVKDDNDDDDEADNDDDDDEQDITAEDNDNEDTTEVNEKTTEDNKDDDDDDNNDDEDEENNDNDTDDDNDDDNDNNSQNKNDDDDNDDDDNDNDDEDVDDDVSAPVKSTTLHSHNAGSKQQQANTDDDDDDEDDDPFDEEDDDGTFESMETVVDNDAEEISLLQEKARQQAAEAAKNAPPSAEDDTDDPAEDVPSWASSLAVKIGVGVALALVARIVLLRKNPNATEEPIPEVLMKRRLTIATAEDTFPEDEDVPPLPTEDEELLGEEEEEEIVVEEEIEYIETDDEETPIQNIGTSKPQQKRFTPETFEELNAMYKPNTAAKSEETGLDVIYRKSTSLSPSSLKTDAGSASVEVDPEPVLGVKNAPANMTLYDAQPNTSVATGAIPKVDKNKEATYAKGTTREVTHDVDYQPEDEDIDYDIDDDVYEEEEVVEEEDELEEDDDANGEGDVSDFDDEELMNRLEMKYGKLPQREHEYESDEDPDDPTWTQIKPKEARGGGPQVDANLDMFEQELRRANEEMLRENYAVALNAFDMLSRKFPDQPQVFLGKAQILDRLSDRERSNKLLYDALEAYKRYLAFGELIEPTAFRAAAERCIERMGFLGIHMQTLPIYEQLLDRFSDEVGIRNQLVVSYLMMNRLSDAKRVLQETLRRWSTDGFAQVHYGFVLKQLDKDYTNAVVYLKNGIDSQAEGTQDGRFFFNFGDALQRLGRNQEALDVYERGVQLKLFPSVYQRSLYNEPNLRAQPFWSKEETSYGLYLDKLEQNWLAIRDEGLSLLGKRGNFLDEAENLRDTGDWQQFELFVRGQRIHKNCQKAPITCSLIEHFNAASSCRRGQVKFSIMQPATHVWSHCGPTNCRLRAHLGLVVPQGTRLRVADEERSWTEGNFLIFDDSFEHEVWHEGSSLRLVLIVDVWHPDLTEKQRQRLTPI